MIVTSNLTGRRHPTRGDEARWVASIDVEWTKNYRVRNGNRAFCYSIVWLAIHGDEPVDVTDMGFHYTSAYVEHADEFRNLVLRADSDLGLVMDVADVIVGHQLCSDLGVLAINALPSASHPAAATCHPLLPTGVVAARDAWHARNTDGMSRMIDTRFDTDAILTGKSRRLVDVCTELDLDVTQPELGRRSMTALHREWLDGGSVEARERITVLNLRHSLSAALVALRALKSGTWTGRVNVNRILDRQLRGTFAWLEHPTFRALVDLDRDP